jgi:chromosome segregation ATPase
VQDTRTPPLLDAIYEQITRGAAGYSDLVGCSDLSDEHNKYQVLTDYSLGYAHLAAQLSAHELDLQNAPMSRENQELEVSVQRIHTESVDSQHLHRQLERSRAREQKLDADLLASGQERERLIELVSTSRRNQQGWKEIAANYKEFYAEAEMTASNLRADLAAASDRVRNVQEQRDHQIELVAGQDSIIQSITKESRLAHTKLRLERDRRVRETKELLHEKVTIRNRYESEKRRLTQEAQDAQEKLDALRDTLAQLRSDGQTPLDREHPPRYLPPTTWPSDTGQPPLPPEWNLDTGTPPVSSAIDPASSHLSTKWSPRSPIQDPLNSSTRLAARLLEIPVVCDKESKVAEEPRAALAELFERMRKVEPESAEDVKPSERDDTRLQGELVATKEQLRLAEEDVRNLRCELGQSRESLREVETHVRALEHELGICQATVREAQDAQYASEVKFTEATQLSRVHQAESESSMARAEESELKCSQATFLCAALRERVTELEAKVRKLKSARKNRAHSNSRSRRPTGTCTGMLAPDLRYAVSHSYISGRYQISKQLHTIQGS